jgi:hypothetical protein
MSALGLFCFDFVGGWLIWAVARAPCRGRKQNLFLAVAFRVGLVFFGVFALAAASYALTNNRPIDFLCGMIAGCFCWEAAVFWLSARASKRLGG